MSSIFQNAPLIYGAAIGLRLIMLCYGAWQDANSAVKYTDIDYMVFTDAARYVSAGESPYARDTYRYTPLLAWMLLPTTWSSIPGMFAFGKALFATADVVAGWLVARSLRITHGMSAERALKYASFWLLNPMVANISTRGSSEGLLGVLVVALLWATLGRRVYLAGVLLGFGVHFKIYPFVYGISILWWLDDENMKSTSTTASTSTTSSTSTWTSETREPEPKSASNTNPTKAKSTIPATLSTIGATAGSSSSSSIPSQILSFIIPCRIQLTLTALATFALLNAAMYLRYGMPFLQHTYLHHLTRIDHRHNFSPYSTLLYLAAAKANVNVPGLSGEDAGASFSFESLAFIPQLLLSVTLIPLILGKKDLPGTMLTQTFAFVTFNKVCTSQYFLWYLIFLPFYLPTSSLLQRPRLGITVAVLWVVGQATWLHQGYLLEFLGVSSFVPGLFLASLGFFTVNVWILGVIVGDVGGVRT
ncbi:glycosylphosphatidylinositol-alpha 1,4 mannosyltransferase I [Aspergillus undulatus]|uniref:glycosylphosphatidylinositol-alpha 1,4 mannosyltransferase I n=1 Tax=Aspergillus undulatus TaxID=1810928 RepID=UPI003CCCA40F